MDLTVSLFTAAALLTGTATFFVVRRDLSRGAATGIAVATGLAVGLSFMFILYLAVVAWVVAIGAYLLARPWLKNRKLALLAGAAAYTAVAVLSAAAFVVALSNM
ncbi:hypothetical protein [Winogradskya consettensis]|nr:hypothetical protein [Actinoplanes consettensis]